MVGLLLKAALLVLSVGLVAPGVQTVELIWSVHVLTLLPVVATPTSVRNRYVAPAVSRGTHTRLAQPVQWFCRTVLPVERDHCGRRGGVDAFELARDVRAS